MADVQITCINKTPRDDTHSGITQLGKMLGMSADQARIFTLFFPHAAAAYMRVLANGTRFVQYTQAESAIKMLRSKSVWMRKALWLNDYREIDHGWELLLSTFRDSEAGTLSRDAAEILVA